jgi:hypothetical protein
MVPDRPMIAKFTIGSLTYTREIQSAKPELIVAPPLRLEFNPQKASSLLLSVFRLQSIEGGVAHYVFARRVQ